MKFSNFINILSENYPNICLSDDELQYISTIFDDDNVQLEDIKDVTEDFLNNAGMDDNETENFYSILKKQLNLSYDNSSQTHKIDLVIKIYWMLRINIVYIYIYTMYY